MITKLFIALVIFLTMLGALMIYYEYSAIKKYYPEMSFTDFIFLGDKIRITPEMK